MAGPWDTPPTSAEMAGARRAVADAASDPWGTPPTAVEMRGSHVASSDQDLISSLAAERTRPFGEAGSQFPLLRENSDEGLPGWTRAAQSFKGSKVGEFNWLRSRYGPDNVEPVLSEPKQVRGARGEHIADPNYAPQIVNFRVRVAPDKIVMANPKGADMGDVADFAAGAVEMAPGVIGGTLGGLAGGVPGAVAGSTVGSMAGNSIVQSIGGLLPGDENLSTEDRATSMAMAGAAGAAGELVGPASRAAGRFIVGMPRAAAVGSPGRMASKMLSEVVQTGEKGVVKQTGRDAALANRQLGKETGVDFTLPQLTGGQEALHTQGKLLQMPKTGQILSTNEANQALQAERYTRSVIDKQLGPNGERVGSMTAAENVGAAHSGLVDRLYNAADASFERSMGEATIATGGKKTLPASNFATALEELHAAHHRPISSSSDAAVAEKVAQWRASLGDEVALSPRELQNMLKDFGKKARTGDGLIKDVARDEQGAIAKRLKAALMADLDAAAESGAGGNARAAQLVRDARTKYRADMQDIETTVSPLLDDIKKKIGVGSHDEFAKLVLSNGRSPNQIVDAVKVLNRADATGATTIQLRDSVLQRMIEDSVPKRANLVSAGVTIDPAPFAGQANKFDKQIRALYTGDAPGYLSFRKGVDAMRKITDYAGMAVRGSQTGIMSAADAGSDTALTAALSPKDTAISWLRGLTARQQARLISDPRRVDILLGIEKAARSMTREAYDAVSNGVFQLTALDQRDERLFGAPPKGDEPQPSRQLRPVTRPRQPAVANEGAYP